MTADSYDLVVIGAGPGGYTAAIRARQLGMTVACVDEHEAAGGTCLRVGCIPSKALLESSERYWEAQRLAEHGVRFAHLQLDLAAMMARKDRVVATLTRGVESLLRKSGVHRLHGRARLDRPGTVRVAVPDRAGAGEGAERTLHARHVLIATGSRAALLPGVSVDGDRVVTSTEALGFSEVPSHLVVIGAGYIGLELGSVWNRLGARVTVCEASDRILPGTDGETARLAAALLERQGLQLRLGQGVRSVRVEGETCRVELADGEPLKCDRVLVAAGRVPNTDRLGLASVGIEPDETGRIPVDERFRAAEGVYAVGDVIRGPMLAHKAEREGIACVEGIAGRAGFVNDNAIPAVVYTQPEIASVGQTEEQLQEAGVAYRRGVFPMRANGRARCIGAVDGQVKVLADAATDRVLGVHIVGPRAGDLIAEAVAAIEFGASSEDIALCTHAHPTLAEAVKEGALAVLGRAIHI